MHHAGRRGERRRWLAVSIAAAVWGGADAGTAQMAPPAAEVPAIAAQFPDPGLGYQTPAFYPGETAFPGHAEVLAFLDRVASRAPGTVSVDTAGTSQEGRPLPVVRLAGRDGPSPYRPTVLILAQQHGNEPAGGEAALALVDALAGPHRALLDQVNVLVVPRANPDGAERFVRATASGVDVNRDHLLLQTPEARALAGLAVRHRPDVVLDLHEFTVAGRWVAKYGVVQRYDALLQAAGVGNLAPEVAREAEAHFLAPVRTTLAAAGLAHFDYHTTSQDPADKVVSMGGVQPDTGRNVNGLRQAVSLLIETRGVGLDRQHLARRVHTHVVAALEVIRQAARRGPQLLAVTRGADAAVTATACRGPLVVAASHTPTRRRMSFLDATNGQARPLVVPWRAAAPLRVDRWRRRPCGYLLGDAARPVVDRLIMLGVRVQPVEIDGVWDVERYVVTGDTAGTRQDARGAIDDGAPIRRVSVRRARGREPVTRGTWHVDLAQPLASLAAAALEPDSQNGFVAAGMLEVGDLRRVLAAPPPTRTMALTVDDLPFVAPEGGLGTAAVERATAAILGALRARGAPVVGFVSRDHPHAAPAPADRDRVVDAWRDAGHLIGNHTATHSDLNELSAAAFLDDVTRGHPVVPPDEPFFRHPFTHTGDTAEKKAAVARALADRGLVVAPYTIAPADDVFNAALVGAERRGDTALAARVGEAYLDHAEAVTAFAEAKAVEIFARDDVPQTLLIHANRLHARFMDQLLARLAARGYRFVPLREALADPAYRSPDTLVTRHGPSWLFRWARSLGRPVSFAGDPEPPTWIRDLAAPARRGGPPQ
ncbi:MAG: M14 family zinc carboxypeptidase [Vicinamibacterales bacterium]